MGFTYPCQRCPPGARTGLGRVSTGPGTGPVAVAPRLCLGAGVAAIPSQTGSTLGVAGGGPADRV